MKLDSLESLNDNDLQAIIARAGELLKDHDRERKDKALSEATAILAKAGLSLKEVAQRSRTRPKAGGAYRSGRQYQHPTNKTLVWTAKGK